MTILEKTSKKDSSVAFQAKMELVGKSVSPGVFNMYGVLYMWDFGAVRALRLLCLTFSGTLLAVNYSQIDW